MIDAAQRRAAKIAGLAYLFTMVIVVVSNFGIHERLEVHDAGATARNILAHERLFRISVACDLVYCAGLIALIAALYVILRPVDLNLTVISTLWKLVYALAWLLMTLSSYDALRLLHRADYLQVFEPERLQALAKMSLNARFERYYVGLLLYALGATVSSYLWIKSRYVPRALAIAGVVSAAFCVFCTFVFLIVPSFSGAVNLWWFDTPLALFDLALSLWLLIKGLRPEGQREFAYES